MGAANVDPAPFRVADAPLPLELEPPAAGAGLPPLLLLLLLDPHAAIPSDATTSVATAAIRLIRTFVSLFIRIRSRVSGGTSRLGLIGCEPLVARGFSLRGQPVAEPEVGVDEA